MITAIGMIKNAADIIETFVRANGLVVDNFVLLDNMSTDNTVNILTRLIDEGYRIDIISDTESAYFQSRKMNLLLKHVVKNYNSDWIIPIDDDEILISKQQNVSPKEIIEKLDPKKVYYVKWRNYIPTDEDDYNEICVIRRQQFCFKDNLRTYNKVIISKEIALDEKTFIMQGNHDISDSEYPKVLLPELCMAHFPCRSREQIMSKGLVGWTNNLAMYKRNPNHAKQWRDIYDMVKSGNEITTEMLWNICFNYVEVTEEGELVEKKSLVLPEEAYAIRYTKANEVNPFLNYMKNTEQLAERYAELYRRLTGEENQ